MTTLGLKLPGTRGRIVPSLIGIGLDKRTACDAAEFDSCVLSWPEEALHRLTILHFDLLIAGPMLNDDVFAVLAERLCRQSPSQRWAIVARQLEEQRERFFRTLGSSGVFDDLCTCLRFACPRQRNILGPAPPTIPAR